MKITVSSIVQAPIAEVWRAYNSPEDIQVWNTASPDWHTTASTVDLREGGKFSSRMEAKDGSSGFDFAGEYTSSSRPGSSSTPSGTGSARSSSPKDRRVSS